DGDLDPQVERVERAVQDQLVDTEVVAPGLPADHGRAQRALDDMPDRGEEDEPDDHPRDQAERYLDYAIAQLTDVIHERHPALGVLLPLRLHEALADDAGTRDSTREFRHDRFRSKVSGLGLARLSPLRLSWHAGAGRGGVHGSGPLHVTDLLLQRVDLALLVGGSRGRGGRQFRLRERE